MLYEAELFVSSRALLSLEPRDAGALARLSTLFGFTTRLAQDRQARLAAAIERVLAALQTAGINDAIFATRDGKPCFVDRVGEPEDLDLLSDQAGEAPVDFEVLRLFVRERDVDIDDAATDPYRGAGVVERHQLQLAVDVEIHRVVPFDGYPLRLRIHGLITELRAGPEESWDDLIARTSRYIARTYPDQRVGGHEGLPAEFRTRVDRIVASLSAKFNSDQIDRADRSALIVPRQPRMAALPEVPEPFAAGSFAHLPGLERSLRYLYAWPEVHGGLAYEQMLILDGRGRRMLATGPTPVVVSSPDTLAPSVDPLHLPVPDLLVFSGHEWDAEARRERVIPRDASCEGLEGTAALTTHERRKFDCGRRGPARGTSIGGYGNLGSSGYPGEFSF